MTRTYDAGIEGHGRSFAVVVARFNEHVTRRLLDGAVRAFEGAGVAPDNIAVLWVPGSFELAGAAARAFDHLDVEAVVCLGTIIRGETAHFDFVARGTTDGIREVGLKYGRPVIFGVLTVDTQAQADARASDGPDNKGFEAALTALEMTNLFAAIAAGSRKRV